MICAKQLLVSDPGKNNMSEDQTAGTFVGNMD